MSKRLFVFWTDGDYRIVLRQKDDNFAVEPFFEALMHDAMGVPIWVNAEQKAVLRNMFQYAGERLLTVKEHHNAQNLKDVERGGDE